jgi:hypothetical protein
VRFNRGVGKACLPPAWALFPQELQKDCSRISLALKAEIRGSSLLLTLNGILCTKMSVEGPLQAPRNSLDTQLTPGILFFIDKHLIKNMIEDLGGNNEYPN